jgi:hypothetical protein
MRGPPASSAGSGAGSMGWRACSGGPQIGGLVESQLTMAVRTVRAAGYALETEQV